MTEAAPRSEGDFLDEQSRHARDALTRLRGELVESLERTADIEAWAGRYPWHTIGAAAIAGISAGWALGRPRGSENGAQQQPDELRDTPSENGHAAPPKPSATSRLLGSLGTLIGAVASTAAVAASQALGQVVKDSIRDSLRPSAPDEASRDPR